METRKAATIFDNVILVIGIWLLSYLWTRYYVMNLLVALIAASGISLCVIMLINLKRQKNKTKQKKQKHIDNIMNQFLYGGKDFSADFLFSALKNKFSGNESIKVSKNKSFILVGKTAVFCKFSVAPLTFEQLIECFSHANRQKAKKMIILSILGCDKIARQNLDRLPDIGAYVFDKNKSYDFFGWLGAFPKITFKEKKKRRTLKNLASAALSPTKAKHYLIISLVLMISSYFVMYSIYYIIIASVTFALAILSKINIAKRLKRAN